ncbi:MAG: dipeptide/oligopeptide/nickel ABC transporter ATP-binding protein [bacterium]|nr:dipeptide/oligopeptide/nickel ABC transporter ATP-binding protein [bacterium]
MLLEVQNLKKRYSSKLPYVINSVSFSMDHGETVGIFGGSGCGKSTIGQTIAGLYSPSGGTLLMNGQPMDRRWYAAHRRSVQILFQHPEVSFDPRMTLEDSMREPYHFYNIPFRPAEHKAWLARFGIYPEHMNRYPAELSGGELQRMALARAMLLSPQLLILDEPTSMLDVISQAQIIALLRTLQAEQGLGFLFISHDIELSRMVCERIHHLENGVIAETENCRRAAQPA